MDYPQSFKENAVRRLLAPGSEGLSSTAKKLNVPPSTLFGWKKKYANNSNMNEKKDKSTNM